MVLAVNEKATINLLTINGYTKVTRKSLRPIPEHRELFYQLTGKKQIFPLDSYLEIDKYSFKVTPQMMLRIAKEGITERSYEKVQEKFHTYSGIDIDADSIREITNFVASVYLQYESKCRIEALERIPELNKIPREVKFTKEEAGILFVSVNGSYSPLIAKKGIEWKDTKLGILFNLMDCTYQGNKAIYVKDYVICVGSKDEFESYLALLLVRNDAHYYQEVTSVADGAPWIELLFDKLIPDHDGILDLYHLRECIGKYFA